MTASEIARASAGHRGAGRELALLLALVFISLAAAAISARPEGQVAAQGAADAEFVEVDTWRLPTAPPAPIDLALGPADWLYVAEGRHNTVQAHDAGGRLVGTWDHPPIGRDPGFVYVPIAVAADAARDRVYVLWERYVTGADLQPNGLFFDTRRPNGQSTQPLRAITEFARATDMAVHGPTGDLYFTGDGRVFRMRPRDGAGPIFELFDAGDTQGAAGRLAVLHDERVALVRPAESAVGLFTMDGLRTGALDISDGSPVAVATDADGNVVVLVRAAEPDDPSAPIVITFDAGGARIASVSAAAVGAPLPPAGDWPWSVSAAADAVALTTAADRLEIHRYRPSGGPSSPALEGGPVQPAFRARDGSSDIVARTRLAMTTAPDGDLLVLDAYEERLVRYDLAGVPTVVGWAPADALDVAVDAEGAIYLSTAAGRLMRRSSADAPDPTWDVACDCDLGGRLTVGADRLYVSRPRSQSVAAVDVLTGASIGPDIAYTKAVGLWPSDLALGPEGRLFSADLVMAQVQAWSATDAPEATWPAGLLAGPRRLAGGQLDDGRPVVAAAMADGFVEIHMPGDGNLVARFAPLPSTGRLFDVADIGIAAGNVLLADPAARAVRVFGPGVVIPPTPPIDRTATPTPSDAACTVIGDQVAAPGRIELGDSASVTLTLAADCPVNTRVVGADIVLTIDRSGSMIGGKMEAAQAAARTFAELLDIRYHRLGLASFSEDASIDVPLTDNIPAVIDRIDALAPQGGTNISAAIERADANLRDFGRPEALPVIVLLTDGKHQDDPLRPDPRAVADDARNRGVQIYTIGLGDDVEADLLRDIATSPERYFFAPSAAELFPIYGQILRLVVSSLAGNLIIDVQMGDDVTYVDGSAHPAPLAEPSRLRWGRSILPSTGITLTWQVQPRATGQLPVSRQAEAEYTDGDGVRRRYAFPRPVVEVYVPTPTPTPTATPVPIPIFLPLAWRAHCLPGTAHADVAVLIDTSNSMAGGKLVAAKRAASLFVRLLELPRDQATIVGFNAEPTIAARLTGDIVTLEDAIEGLASGGGTRINSALDIATRELISPRRDPRNRPVVILLSDGAHSGPAEEVLRSAAAARSVGTHIFSIGLGRDTDEAMLQAVADPGSYYFAPDEDDLEAIYFQIAVEIPCR